MTGRHMTTDSHVPDCRCIWCASDPDKQTLDGSVSTQLRLVASRHDLPVSWDGDPVTWSPWSVYVTSLRVHLPPGELRCHACAVCDQEPAVALGLRQPLAGATFAVPREKRTRRTGRAFAVTVDVPAWPVWDLVAYRCLGCGHDFVYDARAGEWWDLEPDDYGHDGSSAVVR